MIRYTIACAVPKKNSWLKFSFHFVSNSLSIHASLKSMEIEWYPTDGHTDGSTAEQTYLQRLLLPDLEQFEIPCSIISKEKSTHSLVVVVAKFANMSIEGEENLFGKTADRCE